MNDHYSCRSNHSSTNMYWKLWPVRCKLSEWLTIWYLLWERKEGRKRKGEKSRKKEGGWERKEGEWEMGWKEGEGEREKEGIGREKGRERKKGERERGILVF